MAPPILLNVKTTFMSDKDGVLKQYEIVTPAASAPDGLAAERISYAAIETYKGSAKGTLFRIVDAKGNFDFYSFTHIVEGSYRDDMLTLTTTSRVFVLSGKNLAHIAEQISERKLKALYEFNTEKHVKPDDENAVFIESITRN